MTSTDKAYDTDTFWISLRGACFVAALSYAEAFGEPKDRVLDEADEMYRRVRHLDRNLRAA